MNQHRSDLHALAAAYALDALEDGERQAFDAHLQVCEACRQEAAEFRATAARLAAGVAQPPPASAKAQVLAAIDEVRQLPPRVPATVATASAPAVGGMLRRRAVPLALAAGVATAALGGIAVWQTQNGEDFQAQTRQAQQRLDTISTVLAAPDARTVHGRAANGALTTVVASDRQNKAVFTAANLPAPGEGKTYQLWLDHDGTMRPAGLIDHDGTVILTGNPADAGAVGLTLEPFGGSPQPTTDPLLLMTLPA
ncbi:anti-sigma factor [Streptomyces showdoensis]|uniref:Regulator of SigK n=1 Tax=Streptomyces showdoensis TaxID=68268 RepID=A0A2P2GM08_STREW|nr:anti-sigma factor [Streptomyces showdoensis]KKZ72551.1 anti-sigma-K factor RskA [Streptomyces showdoensis]